MKYPLTDSQKGLLEKLLKDDHQFKCEWNGEVVNIEILQIDFTRNCVYVRFEKEVTKKITEFIDAPFSHDIEPPQIMIEKEVKTQEEWISI